MESDSGSVRWPAGKAKHWYSQIDIPIGANFVPSSAINQLEMWQADTFDLKGIDRELGWASSIGMNTMRTFLHDLVWKQDPEGFMQRIDQYLEIAESHGIRTMFVFFESVWNPYPQAGRQPEPEPRVHNPGWVQSPGRLILENSDRQDGLEDYIKSILGRYKDDARVLIWDLFNEPDNANVGKYGGDSKRSDLDQTTKNKCAYQLLAKAFCWAREVDPSQPLTAGVWGAPNWLEELGPIQECSLSESDIITFHSYSEPEETERIVQGLKRYDRPILCTEYMARSSGSTFQGILPIFKQHRVGAYNWGLVEGKTQTIYPWSSWKEKFADEPDPWFHDVLHRDGSPYSNEEVASISNFN